MEEISLIHKFNGGRGATLCNECNVIISTGFTEIIDATTKRWGGMNPETGFVINNVEVNPYWIDVKQEINNL
jgi:hypothetical protein